MPEKNYIESPKLVGRVAVSFNERMSSAGEWFLCGSDLQELFDLPEKTFGIQFRAFREDGPGRYKITILDKENAIIVHRASDSHNYDGVREVDLDTLNSIRKMLGKRRKTWYIEVYYWS